jgi:hypothetical protein
LTLPDQFDHVIRSARDLVGQPEKQQEHCLGALFGLRHWHFVNIGSLDRPRPATGIIDTARLLVVFSSTGKLADAMGKSASSISIPTARAVGYCKQFPVEGLLVNPGEWSFAVELRAIEHFANAATSGGTGFWITHTTTEEDDFWDDLGVR